MLEMTLSQFTKFEYFETNDLLLSVFSQNLGFFHRFFSVFHRFYRSPTVISTTAVYIVHSNNVENVHICSGCHDFSTRNLV